MRSTNDTDGILPVCCRGPGCRDAHDYIVCRKAEEIIIATHVIMASPCRALRLYHPDIPSASSALLTS